MVGIVGLMHVDGNTCDLTLVVDYQLESLTLTRIVLRKSLQFREGN